MGMPTVGFGFGLLRSHRCTQLAGFGFGLYSDLTVTVLSQLATDFVEFSL